MGRGECQCDREDDSHSQQLWVPLRTLRRFDGDSLMV